MTMMDTIREALIKHGQYRDVWYLHKDNDGVDCGEVRCLIVPAQVIEPLLKEVNDED